MIFFFYELGSPLIYHLFFGRQRLMCLRARDNSSPQPTTLWCSRCQFPTCSIPEATAGSRTRTDDASCCCTILRDTGIESTPGFRWDLSSDSKTSASKSTRETSSVIISLLIKEVARFAWLTEISSRTIIRSRQVVADTTRT